MLWPTKTQARSDRLGRCRCNEGSLGEGCSEREHLDGLTLRADDNRSEPVFDGVGLATARILRSAAVRSTSPGGAVLTGSAMHPVVAGVARMARAAGAVPGLATSPACTTCPAGATRTARTAGAARAGERASRGALRVTAGASVAAGRTATTVATVAAIAAAAAEAEKRPATATSTASTALRPVTTSDTCAASTASAAVAATRPCQVICVGVASVTTVTAVGTCAPLTARASASSDRGIVVSAVRDCAGIAAVTASPAGCTRAAGAALTALATVGNSRVPPDEQGCPTVPAAAARLAVSAVGSGLTAATECGPAARHAAVVGAVCSRGGDLAIGGRVDSVGARGTRPTRTACAAVAEQHCASAVSASAATDPAVAAGAAVAEQPPAATVAAGLSGSSVGALAPVAPQQAARPAVLSGQLTVESVPDQQTPWTD